MFSEGPHVRIDSHEWTSILSKLIFQFGSGFFFTTKNTVHNWCGKARNVFSKRIWMKQAAYHFRTDYDLHTSTSNSLFVVSRQNVALRRKKYLRHNNLMTGVLWRTLRSKYNKSNFLVLQKRYFGWGNFTFWRIESWYLFSVIFCNLTAQSGKRRKEYRFVFSREKNN